MAEYIEREAVHKMMAGLTRYSWTSPVSAERRVTVDADEVNFGVDKIPAADVEPVKHGKWLPQIVLGQRAWDCSECKTLGSPHWKRCPVCEAKMEVSDA